MARQFYTEGTGNQQTLHTAQKEKIPVYDSIADVTADLANLSAGQIGVTKDTGNELAQPVNAVESGNLHAVTSNAVAESLSYSTEEVATGGKWIDGKPIYRKTVEIGNLPNNTVKQIANVLSNVDNIVEIRGVAKSSTLGIVLPYIDISGGVTYLANIYVSSKTHLQVNTNYNFSSYTGFAVIYYTKTTD